MKVRALVSVMGFGVLVGSKALAVQYPTIDPGYNQQIYTGPLVGGPGMAWTTSSHLLTRLHRQAVLSADPELSALADELRGYPGVASVGTANADAAALLFVPLVLRTRDGQELTFFSTLATFGTALDITLSELAIESFFPADDATAAFLNSFWEQNDRS